MDWKLCKSGEGRRKDPAQLSAGSGKPQLEECVGQGPWLCDTTPRSFLSPNHRSMSCKLSHLQRLTWGEQGPWVEENSGVG